MPPGDASRDPQAQGDGPAAGRAEAEDQQGQEGTGVAEECGQEGARRPHSPPGSGPRRHHWGAQRRQEPVAGGIDSRDSRNRSLPVYDARAVSRA